MPVASIFHGSEAEALDLLRAANHHCTCMKPDGPKCSSHAALLDQRTIDHLLFMRRIVWRLRAEESLMEYRY
jgi:hypothetical protein